MSNFKCVVDANLFARAMFCASKEEARYYLQGVCIESNKVGGATLTATDGRCLVTFHDPDAIVEGVAIVALDPATLKACTTKQRVARGGFPNVLAVNGKAQVVEGHYAKEDRESAFEPHPDHVLATQVSRVLIDGSFPDWRRVIPQETHPEKAWGSFNPAILANVAKALKGDGIRNQALRVIATGEPNEPAIVFGECLAGFGVVMPLWSTETRSVPEWARRA